MKTTSNRHDSLIQNCWQYMNESLRLMFQSSISKNEGTAALGPWILRRFQGNRLTLFFFVAYLNTKTNVL